MGATLPIVHCEASFNILIYSNNFPHVNNVIWSYSPHSALIPLLLPPYFLLPNKSLFIFTLLKTDLLNLIRVVYVSVGQRLLTGTWATTYQWLYHWRKCLLPKNPLSTTSSSAQDGASWASLSPMVEICEASSNTGNHSCYELMSVTAMPCAEESNQTLSEFRSQLWGKGIQSSYIQANLFCSINFPSASQGIVILSVLIPHFSKLVTKRRNLEFCLVFYFELTSHMDVWNNC